MKRKTVVGLSLIIASIVIVSTLFVGAVTIIDSKNNIPIHTVNPTEEVTWIDEIEDNKTTVIVPIPSPDIQLVKKVKNDGNWAKSVTVDVGDIVEFKLIITNTGDVELTSVHVTDDLPSFLTYNDDHLFMSLMIYPAF